MISAAGLQSAQRVQAAANNARLRARRAVAAPLRADALPLPPPDRGDQPDADGDHADPPAPPVLPPGRQLGCTKCRFQATGCKQCQRPNYVPRGKGRGKGGAAKARAEPKAKAKGRGRGRGRSNQH